MGSRVCPNFSLWVYNGLAILPPPPILVRIMNVTIVWEIYIENKKYLRSHTTQESTGSIGGTIGKYIPCIYYASPHWYV